MSATPRQPAVALLGGRASGKSSIGPVLARTLGRPFIDLDVELARAAGSRSAGTVLTEVGEAAFRRLELRALCAVARRREAHVLATGGGTIETAGARRVLSARYRCVWLVVDPDVARRRMAEQPGVRPALSGTDPLAEVERMLERRAAHWRALADWVIEVGERSPERLAEELAHLVRM